MSRPIIEMNPNDVLMDWAIAVLQGNRPAANEHYFALRVWMERGGPEPKWGEVVDGWRLPSRQQFFSFNPNTGRIQ